MSSGSSIVLDGDLTWVHLEGRLDSTAAPLLTRQLDQLVLDGRRLVLANLERVSFLSSAGLRVLLAIQQQLVKLGGELVLYRPSGSVGEVIEVSGLSQVLRCVSSVEDVRSSGTQSPQAPSSHEESIDGLDLRVMNPPGTRGRLRELGSANKLASACYEANDVVTLVAGELPFAAGVGALGRGFDECRPYFGEALVVHNSLFFYPATRRPVADFMLASKASAQVAYSFLHGFGFTGEPSWLVGFARADQGSVTLDELAPHLLRFARSDLVGLVILAESKGLLGMHLKRVPVAPEAPPAGQTIFDAEHFADWFSFPVEPTDVSNVVVGVGLARRLAPTATGEGDTLLSPGSSVHVHGAIFGRRPFDHRLERFGSEIDRVIDGLAVERVVHLLGSSRFSRGTIGLIELGG